MVNRVNWVQRKMNVGFAEQRLWWVVSTACPEWNKWRKSDTFCNTETFSLTRTPRVNQVIVMFESEWLRPRGSHHDDSRQCGRGKVRAWLLSILVVGCDVTLIMTQSVLHHARPGQDCVSPKLISLLYLPRRCFHFHQIGEPQIKSDRGVIRNKSCLERASSLSWYIYPLPNSHQLVSSDIH